mgnify:FL=1|jgi:hypothetical protein|tara:strand:- start:351 stop:515 length:165 start_codon:yes stop_codon:yes gene_type:complete
MKVRVKMFLTLEVDTEEYQTPADGDFGIELEDGLKEFLHEVEGIEIKNIRTITE